MIISKRFSHYSVFLLLRGAVWLTRPLPWRFGVALGGMIGLLFFYCSGRYRRRSYENLKIAFGANEMALQIVKKSFVHLGKTLIELLKISSIDPNEINKLVSWEGEEYLQDAKQNGILLVTGHIGNWELMGAALALRGYRLHAIAAPLHNPYIDRWMIDFRSRFGVETVSRGTPSSSRRILDALKKKEMLALLIDQDTKKADGVFVDFFNKKAYTPTGAAQLALRSDATAVTAFITRLPDGRHQITVEKPLILSITGDRKQDVETNTALLTTRIEQHIRCHPDQWVWMHQRWNSTEEPEAEAAA
jgi:KDO2-lipid IV(A) lauroyltransferase